MGRREMSLLRPLSDHTLYIAGPMSSYPEHNFPAFHEAEKLLRDKGFRVANPVSINTVMGQPWEYYMREDLLLMLQCATGVAVLSGWQESKGATFEVHVAHVLKMPVLTVERWLEFV